MPMFFNNRWINFIDYHSYNCSGDKKLILNFMFVYIQINYMIKLYFKNIFKLIQSLYLTKFFI